MGTSQIGLDNSPTNENVTISLPTSVTQNLMEFLNSRYR